MPSQGVCGSLESRWKCSAEHMDMGLVISSRSDEEGGGEGNDRTFRIFENKVQVNKIVIFYILSK